MSCLVSIHQQRRRYEDFSEAPAPTVNAGEMIHKEVNMHVAWQTSVALYRKGSMNIYGESKYHFMRSASVGVVNFTEGVVQSSVRADSSGSRGKADVETFNAHLIAPLGSGVKLDDVIVMEGVKLVVVSVQRRWGLRGRQGHLEIGANVWV